MLRSNTASIMKIWIFAVHFAIAILNHMTTTGTQKLRFFGSPLSSVCFKKEIEMVNFILTLNLDLD